MSSLILTDSVFTVYGKYFEDFWCLVRLDDAFSANDGAQVLLRLLNNALWLNGTSKNVKILRETTPIELVNTY